LYEPRTYRNLFNTGRFTSFTLHYRDTDLWIGTDPASFSDEMTTAVASEVTALWKILEDYSARQPQFLTSLEPLTLMAGAPDEALLMEEAGKRAHTGPMAAVAGLFAWKTGEMLRQKFHAREVVVENGGDFYLYIGKELNMTIFAGESSLSGKIAVTIPAAGHPWGVCTSSGTVGHSFSFGRADAAMVACTSPVVADALATSMANRVQTPDDIATVLNYSQEFPEIRSIILICKDKLGIRGNFEVRIVKK
jgi:uncharacterized protein